MSAHAATVLLALLERGARYVLRHGEHEDRDARKVGEITVTELADVLGIADVEVARAMSREARETAAKSVEAAQAMFANVAGLRSVAVTGEIPNAKALHDLAERLTATFVHHPEVRLVAAIAWVEVGADGSRVHKPVAVGTIN